MTFSFGRDTKTVPYIWSVGVWWHHWKLPLHWPFLFSRNLIRRARRGQCLQDLGILHEPGEWGRSTRPKYQNWGAEWRSHCKVQREKTEERGRRGPTDGKTSEGVMNYSCTISAYEATWKSFTVERSRYNTFYGSSHCKYPLFRRFEITTKHLPNTNLRGLADHKRTELTKRHLHIPPSCTRGLDNYLHFGT